MSRPRVYVETTIPNFFHETRTAPEMVLRREATRSWWATAPQRYDLLTSSTVLLELAAGTGDRAIERMDLLENLPILFPNADVSQIVFTYVRHKIMPAKPTTADAIHLALASYHQCDYLVTWNCQHLANPNKAAHIVRINNRLGLHVPELVTPADLIEREG
jgi:predicted nucleic acid-binding protein